MYKKKFGGRNKLLFTFNSLLWRRFLGSSEIVGYKECLIFGSFRTGHCSVFSVSFQHMDVTSPDSAVSQHYQVFFEALGFFAAWGGVQR